MVQETGGDSGQVLVVRTELRQGERLLRSPCFYTMLTSAALSSGVALKASQLHLLTSAPRGKIKSYLDLDVTIIVGITTVAGALINRNTNSRTKSKFRHEVGGGGFDCDDVIMEIYL